MASKKTLDANCRRIADIRLQLGKMDKIKHDLVAELDDLFLKVLPMIEETDQKDWHVKGVGEFGPSWDTYFNIVDQDRLQEQLRKTHQDALIRIHPGTIKEWAKGELEKMKQASEKLKASITEKAKKLPAKARQELWKGFEDYTIDANALCVALVKKYGLTFIEKGRINFRKREGKYKTLKGE